MARYILLNARDGSLHGDTACIPGCDPDSPFDAALALDKAMGRARRGYGRTSKGSRDATYDAYVVTPVPALAADATDEECRAHALRHGTHAASLISYVS